MTVVGIVVYAVELIVARDKMSQLGLSYGSKTSIIHLGIFMASNIHVGKYD